MSNPLERRRVNLGYSQQEISSLLGITQSQYSRIENGATSPNKHLKRLSEIFSCEPNEVFQGEILKEIENGLCRRMRRELQFEPLILCLVQPAPSGTPAYKPRTIEEPNGSNKNKPNNNHKKQSMDKVPNKNINTNQNLKTDSSEKDQSLTGRTRRRRSALTT